MAGGQLSSQITLTDSADGVVQGLRIYGKSEQVRYSGYNLYKEQYNTWGTIEATITTSLADHYFDSYFNETATYSRNSGFYIGIRDIFDSTIQQKLIDSGYCTFSADVEFMSDNTSAGIRFGLDNGGSQLYIPSNASGRYSSTRKLSTTKVNDWWAFIAYSITPNCTVHFRIKNIQIECGDVGHEYEPYVGGIPSPSPEYPQLIKTSNNTIITSIGKNLIDLSDTSRIYVSAQGDEIGSPGDETTGYIGVDPSINLTMSGIQKQNTQYAVPIRIAEYDENKTFITRQMFTKGASIKDVQIYHNFTLDTETRYIRAMFNTSDYIYRDTWQLEIGNQLSQYQQHKKSTFSIEKDLRAVRLSSMPRYVNLLDIRYPVSTESTSVQYDIIRQTASDTRDVMMFKVQLNQDDNIIERPFYNTEITSTRTIQCTFIKKSTFNTIRFGHNGISRDVCISYDISNLVNGESYTFSCVISNIKQGSYCFERVQLEKGTVKTNYEIYMSPDRRRGIWKDSGGQVWCSDYIDYKNKKLVRNVGKIALSNVLRNTQDLNQTWYYGNDRYSQYVFGTCNCITFMNLDEYNMGLMCDCLYTARQSGDHTGLWFYHHAPYTTMSVLIFKYDDINTVEDANQRKQEILDKNPDANVYWAKRYEDVEDLTSEYCDDIKTYYPISHLSITSTSTPKIEFEYTVDKKNHIDRVFEELKQSVDIQ